MPPFVGDGVFCTVDTDGDSYPDLPLLSPSCDDDSITTYCVQVMGADIGALGMLNKHTTT